MFESDRRVARCRVSLLTQLYNDADDNNLHRLETNGEGAKERLKYLKKESTSRSTVAAVAK